MSIRNDLIPLIDDVRDEVVDGIAGLRRCDVAVVTRTWSGASRGLGTATNTSIAIEPRPRVRDPSPQRVIAEAGRFEQGDRLVDKISASYAQVDLDGGTLGATVELYWTIDDAPYRVVRVTERYLSWEVQLRPMRGRP